MVAKRCICNFLAAAGGCRAGLGLFGFQRASLGVGNRWVALTCPWLFVRLFRGVDGWLKKVALHYKGKCCALFWSKVRILWVLWRGIILCRFWECKRGYGWGDE